MGKPEKNVVPPAIVPNQVKGPVVPVAPVVPVKNSNKKKKR